ncbi:hypothetical protein [Neisseria animalis]|uniref:Uncharacterized protein n=1 Tax=Neisseria animalis TaxID=492 RepID=A0A5P3MPV8_NEIAN|nr:hypothetical protein [Neisseria animalis]QEY23593.1 hypothetical protein D0T90_03005 [Neisseria animalis]ROW32738.1 hypothetical protein CGZ60_02625 [Neisseria animalis]VEE09294.1 Uncharacterised protein [Neisseria animalis]
MQTTYIVQAFDEKTIKSRTVLESAAVMQFNREDEALRRAGRLSEKHAGVLAVAQEYDEDSGEMGRTTLLEHYGSVPEEILESF